LPADPGAGSPVPDLEGDDLTDRFCRRLTEVDGEAHRVSSSDEALRVVLDLVARHEARSGLAWHQARLPLPGLRTAVAAAGVEFLDDEVPDDPDGRQAHQDGYLPLDIGITGADGGLAESGSLVLEAGPGRPRMASVIPLVHVAILDSRLISPSLSHWVVDNPAAATRSSNLVFVTGPSRTADIEQVLNLGVHGPRHLHVVVIDAER
jgi:L-lactate dehydrogenase complex protein LldG